MWSSSVCEFDPKAQVAIRAQRRRFRVCEQTQRMTRSVAKRRVGDGSDGLAEFEDRKVHAHHKATHQHAKHRHDHGFEQAGQ
mgnify:CR=1 FL=1